MNKNEKIATLKKLGVFIQWKHNVEVANEKFNIECPECFLENKERIKGLLENDYSFYQFIMASFPTHDTPEGTNFWINIARM